MIHSVHKDILTLAHSWRSAGKRVALATVVRTWGSSPRPVGSHLVVNDTGDFAGSVSGGCVEGEVIREARKALADGQSRLLEFGVSNEQAWEVGLACGGQIQIRIQNLTEAFWLDALLTARRSRHSVALITRVSDGLQALWQDGQCRGDLELSTTEADELGERVIANRSGTLQSGAELFVCVYVPAPRLLVVGAVHIAQALIPMATLTGFDVTLIDPRQAFASRERFPEVILHSDWPDQALGKLQPDATTAVVTLSHDPKLDDPALAAALNSPAFYIGALGSKKTHAKRLERLREQGFDETALARIHAPVGLDLGGRLPAEIAVSILAQMLETRYRGSV